MKPQHPIFINLGAGTAIAVLFFFSFFVSPERYLKEARLSCRAAQLVVSFPDMKACTKDPRYQPGCACGPITNRWRIAYDYGLVPLVAALVGWIALRGTLASRLAILNSAVAVALLADLIRALLKHDSTFMVIPFMPVIVAVFCGIASAWFLLFHFCHRTLGKRSNAT